MACPRAGNHHHPKEFWDQRVAPRWLVNGEGLAMFRELQRAVNLIPPFWTRLINSVLVPFPILASCCPRTLISPSLSPSTQKLHDKVYTIPCSPHPQPPRAPPSTCPPLGQCRVLGPSQVPVSLTCLSLSLSVCACLSPSISQFLSLCLCCSLSPTPSHR